MSDDKSHDAHKSGASAAARLRDRIDRGGAGDKVAFSDPAAAPLGTDAEAAGTPPTEEQVRCVAPWDCTHACSPLIMPLFALVPQWVGLTLSRVCAILLTTCVRWCRHCS